MVSLPKGGGVKLSVREPKATIYNEDRMEFLIESNRGYLKFTGRFGLLVKGVEEHIFSTLQKCDATI